MESLPRRRRHDGAARIRAPSSGRAADTYDGGSGSDASSLEAGKPNQAIADQLVVTLDTVKKHVSHLLGKLGAANRTEAVARARELELIP